MCRWYVVQLHTYCSGTCQECGPLIQVLLCQEKCHLISFLARHAQGNESKVSTRNWFVVLTIVFNPNPQDAVLFIQYICNHISKVTGYTEQTVHHIIGDKNYWLEYISTHETKEVYRGGWFWDTSTLYFKEWRDQQTLDNLLQLYSPLKEVMQWLEILLANLSFPHFSSTALVKIQEHGKR